MANTGYKLLIVLGALAGLPACAPVIAFVGYGSGSPAVQIAAQFDRLKLAADGVSYVGSGKSVTDHALSLAAQADCRMFNVMNGDPVCRPTAVATPAPQDGRVTLAAVSGDRFGIEPAADANDEAP